MEDTSNYDKSKYGEARADLHHCESRNEQFDKMLGTIRLQLDAYDGETIGIFGCKNETLTELRERFDESDLASKVCFHGAHGENNFDGTHRIHVMTSHAAKGTEFRAVHLYGAEEYAKHPFNRTRLAYTVVTRAKTALDAYVTGETSKALESAFAQEAHFDPADLFKQ
jgi:superfamily I DNA/RNA helicase